MESRKEKKEVKKYKNHKRLKTDNIKQKEKEK